MSFFEPLNLIMMCSMDLIFFSFRCSKCCQAAWNRTNDFKFFIDLNKKSNKGRNAPLRTVFYPHCTFDFIGDSILSYIHISYFFSGKCNISINIMNSFHMICHSFIFYGLQLSLRSSESEYGRGYSPWAIDHGLWPI